MNKIFKTYFVDQHDLQADVAKILDITDFVADFYRDYISSRVLFYGEKFPEICYPLFFSINFHLLRNYIDSVDRNLYMPNQKQDSSFYCKEFCNELQRIETKRVKQVKDLLSSYISKPEKPFLTEKDIAVDFGGAFIKCCDQIIQKFGPDSMGLVSSGFLESAIFCISIFVIDTEIINQIHTICIEIQREIILALEEYKKIKTRMEVSQN